MKKVFPSPVIIQFSFRVIHIIIIQSSISYDTPEHLYRHQTKCCVVLCICVCANAHEM